MCDALARLGYNVQIYAPARENNIQENYHEYYNAEPGVKLTHLPAFDPVAFPVPLGTPGLWLHNFLYRRELRRALAAASCDLLYTRTPALLPALLSTSTPVILELHQLPRRGRRRFVQLCNRCRTVACLTSAMRDALAEWGVEPQRLMVEGDAVDLRRFLDLPSKEEARIRFDIRIDRNVIGYVGRLKTLGMEKGVGDLLRALALLQNTKKFFGLIVGGPEAERHEYAELARSLNLTKNDVQFTGEVPAADVPAALAACDVLAMPFPDFPHYRRHMSPLKMFEYMAATKPILTSDLPTVRDVLSEETAFFCVPGSPQSIAESLQHIFAHSEDVRRRARNARKLVENHTWERRMERIISVACEQ